MNYGEQQWQEIMNILTESYKKIYQQMHNSTFTGRWMFDVCIILKVLKGLYIHTFKLSKKYGPIFTVYFGPKKMVVLAGYKTIKQALINHDAFQGKEPLPIINDLKLTHGEKQQKLC